MPVGPGKDLPKHGLKDTPAASNEHPSGAHPKPQRKVTDKRVRQTRKGRKVLFAEPLVQQRLYDKALSPNSELVDDHYHYTTAPASSLNDLGPPLSLVASLDLAAKKLNARPSSTNAAGHPAPPANPHPTVPPQTHSHNHPQWSPPPVQPISPPPVAAARITLAEGAAEQKHKDSDHKEADRDRDLAAHASVKSVKSFKSYKSTKSIVGPRESVKSLVTKKAH